VVQKRLRGHQRESQYAALPVFLEQRAHNHLESEVMAHSDSERLHALEPGQPASFHTPELRLEVAHQFLSLLASTMRDEPSRTLGYESTQVKNHQADDRTDAEAQAPAQVDGKDPGVQYEPGRGRARQRAQPEAAVDHQIDAAAKACRNQLVD